MSEEKNKENQIDNDWFDDLENEYQEIRVPATRFAENLVEQIQSLIDDKRITLSMPIQQRVKTWQSIHEKIGRKSLKITSVKSLPDLIGLRIVVQFSRDVATVGDLLRNSLRITEESDTSNRLGTDQFGYSSIHFVVQMKDDWYSLPTIRPLQQHQFKAEIQLRTTAQHIWAAASHTLQYKNEHSVPLNIRRAIHRVSALLEVIDLEFDRVLDDRDAYRESINHSEISDSVLNVDLVEKTLDSIFPAKNKSNNEDYAGFLELINSHGISTVSQLKKIMKENHETAIKYENGELDLVNIVNEPYPITKRGKVANFNHTTLADIALRCFLRRGNPKPPVSLK